MVIIASILILSFLVLIHEAGHFIAAKWAGVKVEEFGLGYPPKALKLFKKWGTEFTLNWIPFGGFVKMKGEEGEIHEKPEGDAFYEKSVLQRLIIIVAGAAVNFLFGVIAFSIVYTWMGIPTLWDQPRIGLVQPNTPAALAHVPEQVTIVAIKHGDQRLDIHTRDQAISSIKQFSGESITLVTTGICKGESCDTQMNEYQVQVRTPEQTPKEEGSVGIVFQVAYNKFYPWYEMPIRGAIVGIEQALGLALYIAHSFIRIVAEGVRYGNVPQELMSPVGIVDEIRKSGAVQEGFLAVLNLAGTLSVNLAIINIMPIPAADGGRAVFIILGKLLSKKTVTTIEKHVNEAGILLLLLLLLLLSIRDIYRIMGR